MSADREEARLAVLRKDLAALDRALKEYFAPSVGAGKSPFSADPCENEAPPALARVA